MTTYTSATLAAALIPDAAEANAKAAGRTIRKFLRDELGEGKAVVGKGGRYALDYNKRELTALAKRFAAWEAKQEADKAARAELKAAQAIKTIPVEVDEPGDLDTAEGDDTPYEGPSDEDIAALLEDDEDIDEL
jgi:hypothetical protein